MSHEWKAGILNASSWHGLESVETIPDVDALIARCEMINAWPCSVRTVRIMTDTGLDVPGRACVGRYADGSQVAYGAVGDRYTPLDPKEWRETLRAAERAGARPSGGFALGRGERMVATFEIDGSSDGEIRNYLLLVDSMDGSLLHSAGGTSIRVVCANTLSMAMRSDAKHAAKLRHTASINDRVDVLRDAIQAHVIRGQSVAALYREARQATLTRAEFDTIIDALFPPAEEGASQAKQTRRDSARTDFARAMQRPENADGATLATVWNAATWLVDRTPTGAFRATRGDSEPLGSLLFGSRGQRVAEVETAIREALARQTLAGMEGNPAFQA